MIYVGGSANRGVYTHSRICRRCSQRFYYLSNRGFTQYCTECGPLRTQVTHARRDADDALTELREWLKEARKAL